MRNRMYGGVRGRKTKVGGKLLRFPPTRLFMLISQSVYLLSTSSVFFNFCCSICLNHDMYKMLLNCRFYTYKISKITY